MGIPRTIPPTSIDRDLKQAVKKNHPTVLPVKQFISTKDLEDLRMLAQKEIYGKTFKTLYVPPKRSKKFLQIEKAQKKTQGSRLRFYK